MKGQHNAWPEEECVPVVLPAAFQEHLYCSPPRTLRSASCAPRSASSWEPPRPLRTAGRLPELAEASRLSSCTAPGAQCNCPGWRPALTEQTPYRPPSSQFWASDPDWRPETGLYCDSLSPPLRPDHRGWEMNQGDMTQTQNTNIKQKCETEILMKNGMGNNEKHKTWSNEQNEWNWNQLCRKNTWQRCKAKDVTLCWEIWSSSFDVSVPMGSELTRCFSVAASHSLSGSSVSWNCWVTTKMLSSCLCLTHLCR